MRKEIDEAAAAKTEPIADINFGKSAAENGAIMKNEAKCANFVPNTARANVPRVKNYSGVLLRLSATHGHVGTKPVSVVLLPGKLCHAAVVLYPRYRKKPKMLPQHPLRLKPGPARMRLLQDGRSGISARYCPSRMSKK
jgi:hypothetical protein